VAEALGRGAALFVGSRSEAEARWPDAARADAAAPRDYAFACVPLEVERRCIGGVAFVFRCRHRFDLSEQAFLAVVAHEAADALLRAQRYEAERAARAEAEAQQQRAAFLAEASAVLASSLDWQATLEGVARLAVPTIADWCSVEVPESFAPGATPVAVAHVDAAKVRHVLALRRRLPDPHAPGGVAAVIRTGRSELYARTPDALLVASADEVEAGPWPLAATSAMVVPLSARGLTVGAITFVSAAGRRYGAADLAIAEEVGRQAGTAVDNARRWEEAQRAIRARDDVLALVSHDLKNPLEAVLLSAALLLRSPESPRVRRHAETLQRSATRMDRLVRELLDASRIDAGRFNVEPRPERLEEIVDEALALFAPLAAEKEISLACAGGPLGVEVPCDRERILQLLSNLIGNAVSFTPRGGHVGVRLALHEADVEVAVADDGPGILPEDLPHLFERYARSRSSRGTGLGLAIARGIVDAHGGRMRVESRPGAGSTFAFTLPR
jgi:signal transduction histidine kinase